MTTAPLLKEWQSAMVLRNKEQCLNKCEQFTQLMSTIFAQAQERRIADLTNDISLTIKMLKKFAQLTHENRIEDVKEQWSIFYDLLRVVEQECSLLAQHNQDAFRAMHEHIVALKYTTYGMLPHIT